MCGIAGYIGKERIDKRRIAGTLELMKNRGPDSCDYAVLDGGSVCVTLLHSRLSIIDLDRRSDQPFTIGDYTLVFNGEIYNYKELRRKLEVQNIKFFTESDTEVLLRAYIEYGALCVNDFEGMWSFAVYNHKKEELFLSRDRFGEKPLYLFECDDGIFFGSEVKFIRSLAGTPLEANKQHVLRYIVNGYKSLYKTDDTFFEGVEELPSASNLVIGSDLRRRRERYWEPVYAPGAMTENEAVEGFRHHFMESVKLRLRADVPLAFCLSGGVDSAAIVSVAAKSFNYDVATFSIVDRDARYNEYDNMKATIDDLGCKNTIIEIPREEPFSRLERLIQYHDAPVYTISYYIHSFLSQAITERGYRVACSGTAADELVTGYYDHFNLYLYEMRESPKYPQYLDEWKKNTGRFVRNPYLKDPELYLKDRLARDHVYLNSGVFKEYLKAEFSEPFGETVFCGSLLRNRMMNEMFHESTPVILHEDDLNSMLYSVENRSPYLDSRLFDFCYSIPSEYLIRDGYGKYILREAVKGILNERVRTDRQKKGFNASINSIVDLKKKENRDYFLEDSEIFELVDRGKIGRLLDRDEVLPNSYSKFLFNVLNAKIFLQNS